MSYFVTGATGFIGRHLVSRLLARKGTVHVLVRKDSLKKLDAHKLLLSGKRGSEKTVSLTAKGEEVVKRYRKVREALLVESVKSAGMDEKRLSEIATLMWALSGHYDQAARAAASL